MLTPLSSQSRVLLARATATPHARLRTHAHTRPPTPHVHARIRAHSVRLPACTTAASEVEERVLAPTRQSAWRLWATRRVSAGFLWIIVRKLVAAFTGCVARLA